MKRWVIRYVVTVVGSTVVEAKTAEEAKALVEAGDFEQDHSIEERIDWAARGEPKEDK